MSTPEADTDFIEWDDAAKQLIKPQDRTKPIPLDIQTAAQGEIESAMLLWFLEADLGSIYTLARAAQELVHNVGRKANKPSQFEKRMTYWTPVMKAKIKVPQNFLKHGPSRKRAAPNTEQLDSFVVESMILDATTTFSDIYQLITPLMKLFTARLIMEEPSSLPAHLTASGFLDDIDVEGLEKLSRSRFLVAALARLAQPPNPEQN